MPLVFYTSSVDTLWVSSLGQFFWGDLFGSKWSSIWSSLPVFQFSVSIYSFWSQVCRGWRWLFKTKICVCHLGQGFSSLISLKCWLECVGVCSPKSLLRAFETISIFFIHSAFLLWSFCSHILFQNLLGSFASICWYGFAHSPPTCC